jgi:hypothetical protein
MAPRNARRDMSGIERTRIVVLLGLVAGFGPVFHSTARGQAVGFEPVVSPLFSGAWVGVTPVVSADRRYVRLSLDTSFNQVNGFTPYSVPAAVSGGPGGPGALAGLNGLLGAGGGGGGMGRGGSLTQNEGPLAGPIVYGNGSPPIFRDGQNPDVMNWPKISPDGEGGAAQQDRPADQVATSGTGGRRGIQANTKAIQRQRAAALKSSRQQSSATRRRSR